MKFDQEITGHLRDDFVVARLESPNGNRDVYPHGPTLTVVCDDGRERQVTVSETTWLLPITARQSTWGEIENDALAEPFRSAAPPPHVKVALSRFAMKAREPILVQGLMQVADESDRENGTALAAYRVLAHPTSHLPAPRLQPPPASRLVSIGLVLVGVAQTAVTYVGGRSFARAAAAALSMGCIILALTLRRRYALRFIGPKEMPREIASDWLFVDGSWDEEPGWSLIGGVLLVFFLLLQGIFTFAVPPVAPAFFALWCAAAGIILYRGQRQTVRLARAMVSARMLDVKSADHTWGAVTGAIQTKAAPVDTFGVLSAFWMRSSLKVSRSGRASYFHYIGGTIPFTVVSHGVTWRIDPANATWASAGQIVPPLTQSDDDEGHQVLSAEVIAAASTVLVVGRSKGGTLASPERDALLVASAPPGGDRRAPLLAFLAAHRFVITLPFVAAALALVP